jgi:Winged helix-turn helix
MSKKEFDLLEVLLGVRSGRQRVADACALLSLKRRQVFRLLAGLEHGGAASLVSKRLGRPSNNRLPEAYRDLALSLVRERYADFGPTQAAEKLADVHGCAISRETLRGWMIAAGLWVDRRHRLPSPHQPCRRRDCFGELERVFGTLQDRLVKELRLVGISTVEAANAWLPEFVEDYNKRFGRAPANAKDLHRPLPAADDLDEILAWREERTVTRNLTLRYGRSPAISHCATTG